MAVTSTEEAQLNPVDRKAPSRTAPPAANLDESVKVITTEPMAVPKTQSTAQISSNAFTSSMDRTSWHGATDSISIASSNVFSSSSNAGTIISSGIGSLPRSGSPQLSMVIERNSIPPSGKHTTRRMSDDRLSTTINRVQRTRHDAADVIDEVIAETSVLHERSRTSTNEDGEDDRHGLALFVGKDGEAVVGQHSMISPATLQRVHIGDTSLAS